MQYAKLMQKMTLEEKAGLCSGLDYWHTKPIPRLGVPSIMLSDGPHGLRRHPGEVKGKGSPMPLPAVCFPLACLSACSWDRNLLRKMGKAIGEEALEQKVSVVLGPGVNIKRSPLCGRNFEYFSEDPYLSGEIGAAWIDGVQSNGVGTSLKHFAANSQESYRMTSNSTIDERTMREIYLSAFEKIVKQAKPWTVMSAYNKLNGSYCTENEWLLSDVLRKEWGFDGIVVSDWGAENDRVEALRTGNDLEMPTSNGIGDAAIVKAINEGNIDASVLDERVNAMLHLITRSAETLKKTKSYTFDKKEHHALARKIAGESMVLLKNEDDILPLRKGVHIAVIGEMAKKPRYQGSGSSQVNPHKVDTFFEEAMKEKLHITYADGYDKLKDEADPALIEAAKAIAKTADVVLLFAGLPEQYEAEASDRTHLNLPPCHNTLIEAVCEVNANVVVILSGGAPVAMPWVNKVKGILNASLAGQAGAGAIVDIITGKVNPSGKLSETYPIALEDVPCVNYYAARCAPLYKESVYVGYRYYDTVEEKVLFPFGFGLSYTSFEYRNLSATFHPASESVTVTFNVKNVGSRDGAEVAEVYVHAANSAIYRAEKELKGFEKVFLKCGEEKSVTVELDQRAFTYYNVNIHDWYLENGAYKILVGSSSRDIRLSETLTINTDRAPADAPDYHETAPLYYTGDIKNIPDEQFAAIYGKELPPQVRDPDEPLDFNSTILDGKDVPAVRLLKKIVCKVVVNSAPNEAQGKVAANSVMSIPIRLIISMSQGVISQEIGQSIVDILDAKGLVKPAFKILFGLTKTIKNVPKLLKTVS